MGKNKTVIGEISVEVKTGLSVDRKTAEICKDLLGIYYKNKGCKGLILWFPEDETDILSHVLGSEDVVDRVLRSAIGEPECNRNRNENEN